MLAQRLNESGTIDWDAKEAGGNTGVTQPKFVSICWLGKNNILILPIRWHAFSSILSMEDEMNEGIRDANRIDIHDDFKMRYWGGKLNVSIKEIKEAVRNVGSLAIAVENYLRGKGLLPEVER